MTQTPQELDPVSQAVGRRVRQLRESAGMTQAALSRAIQSRGLSSMRQPALARVEKGERRLLFEEAVAIADVLEASLDDLRPEMLRLAHEVRELVTRIEAAEESLVRALAEYRVDVGDLRAVLDSSAAQALDKDSVDRWSRSTDAANVEDIVKSSEGLASSLRYTREVAGPEILAMLDQEDETPA